MELIRSLKDLLRDGALHSWQQRRKDRTVLALWEEAGRPLPPPAAFKGQLIRDIAKRFATRVLVETGTNWGNTVASSLRDFDRIYSIELLDEFYHRAVRRFARHSKVRLYHGDSTRELPRILRELREPALFWLDAHYSGDGTGRADVDTPIATELLIISTHTVKNHVILIDDARMFNGTNDYPTLSGCREAVGKYWPQHSFEVANDVIRVLPSEPL